ncbi:MAG: hypothetical protein KGL93_09145 [Gemmatimonadota bacterium]|nr:hypothetical protein [Gemmatimonadota bacterium]HEU4988705.1 hypothetical protein [Gemmatimonadaceae bacterium]
MVRMRWLALALVCGMATTVRAQATQDTGKAKPAMAKAATHKAAEHKAEMKMEHKGAKAEKAPSAEKKGTDTAKAGEKTAAKGEHMEKAHGKAMAHHARSHKAKAKGDSTKKG